MTTKHAYCADQDAAPCEGWNARNRWEARNRAAARARRQAALDQARQDAFAAALAEFAEWSAEHEAPMTDAELDAMAARSGQAA